MKISKKHGWCRVRFLIVLALLCPALVAADDRRVAITFDDLPVATAHATDLPAQLNITLKLLRPLKQKKITATGFVNESKLLEHGRVDKRRVDLLRLWLAAGQDLGNHSYSHPDLHDTPLDAFKEDVLRGEVITRNLLAERGRTLRYFRHPYLHTGRDLATKTELEAFLAERGYQVAPVTIDNSEWIFARAYEQALADYDSRLAQRIGGDYVSYMTQVFDFYEDQSRQLFDRLIPQVLLLHANALNADWFATLADALLARGYEFISLDAALVDAAYQSADEYTGAGGITWLHRWAITRGVDPAMFRGEPGTPAYILEQTRLSE